MTGAGRYTVVWVLRELGGKLNDQRETQGAGSGECTGALMENGDASFTSIQIEPSFNKLALHLR